MSNSDNDVSMTPSTSKSTEGVISTTTPELKSQDVCIAEGCNNAAVQHAEWDNEYCSVSCTYKHCKATFLDWLASNKCAKAKAISTSDQVNSADKSNEEPPNEEPPNEKPPNKEQPNEEQLNEEQPNEEKPNEDKPNEEQSTDT